MGPGCCRTGCREPIWVPRATPMDQSTQSLPPSRSHRCTKVWVTNKSYCEAVSRFSPCEIHEIAFPCPAPTGKQHPVPSWHPRAPTLQRQHISCSPSDALEMELRTPKLRSRLPSPAPSFLVISWSIVAVYKRKNQFCSFSHEWGPPGKEENWRGGGGCAAHPPAAVGCCREPGGQEEGRRKN